MEDATPEFMATWASETPFSPPGDLAFVFVRGLFGRWIPGHFAAPFQALRRAGASVSIARTSSTGTVPSNAERLATDVERRVPADRRVVFLCHSKGGLDALEALRTSPRLRERTAGIVLFQTPRAGCAVLESVLLGAHRSSLGALDRASEGAAALALRLAGARRGCLDVAGSRPAAYLPALDEAIARVPAIAVASWSAAPSAWLDAQHARLGAIRPGFAHDGLFWLEDLVWPGARNVLLPRVDHSQPAVGGCGFPHARVWRSLAAMASARVARP